MGTKWNDASDNPTNSALRTAQAKWGVTYDDADLDSYGSVNLC